MKRCNADDCELYHEGGYISKFDVREAIISTMNELKNDPHPDQKVNKDLEQQNLGIIKFQRLLFQKLDLG